MTLSRCTIICVAALLAASCAQAPQRVSRPARTGEHQARNRPPAAASLSAPQFVVQAGSIDLFIIGSSELALNRSSNSRIREFASMMIEAHKGTSAQLSLEGRRLNLLPSATLLPKHQAMLNALQQAQDFDSTYRQQQRTIHAEAVALHSNYAARGTSPTLRPVAGAILPIIQRHIRLLSYL